MAFIDNILQRLRGLPRTPSTPDTDTVQKSGGWSAAFPNAALSTAFGSFVNNTGSTVTPTTALQTSAVYACVKVLSEDVSKLPVCIRRAQHASGRISWVDEHNHPLNRLLRTPNSWQTPFEFWSYIVTSHQLWGNAYVVIRRDNAGKPRELIPVMPARTRVLMDEQGGLYYETQHQLLGSANQRFAAEDMLHIRNMSLDGGFMGMSPIMCAQDVIGLALATQKHAGKLFQQGTILTGVLEHPGSLSVEAAQRLKTSWDMAYAGSDNAHKVAVLEEGSKFTQIGMNANDAQLLESRKYSVDEICRIFRVPPHMIGSLDRATFSNIEQQNIEYVSGSLMGICRRIEEACERNLLSEAERDSVQIRFDFGELLRGDTLARYQGYQLAFSNGFLSRNEIRARENLNPIEGGDLFRVPANTIDPQAIMDINGNTTTASGDTPEAKP